MLGNDAAYVAEADTQKRPLTQAAGPPTHTGA